MAMGTFLDAGGHGPRRLRQLLEQGRPLVLPGAYDALSARLVEAAGFEGVYMTGFGVAASTLGRPDVGLLGLAEMAEEAGRVVAAVTVPVVADADTGYGNAINVIRTVHEYERAGVAGLHIEDQVLPKRCGHLDGKQVVPLEEMTAKIRAAVDARRDPDLVLIARTDARAVEGLDRAVERAAAYAEAGADVLFVEAIRDEKEAAAVARELTGRRLLYNWAEGGRSPLLSYERLAELGYAIVLAPVTALLSATGAIRRVLEQLRRADSPAVYLRSLPTQASFLEAVGYHEIEELEARYR
jgi:carboxyvinyl-carboxyphosphonate phosphorylmutase